MEQGLKEKTGQNLEYWIGVLKKSGIQKHKAMIDFLKTEHGFTYGFANFVAHKTRESDAASHDNNELLELQYQGKENLRPIFEELMTQVSALGGDVTVSPKKAAVSIIRKHQFALIKPATKKRIDLGLKLKGVPTTDRLGDSGPFGTMCTHRIQLNSLDEVDSELLCWIKLAYDQSV